jgi:AraC family transcriptional regulator
MREATAESCQERIDRVLRHISGHLDEPYRLEDLAALAHFSPFHFHRVFRGMVGESVKEHVRRLRLARAARELRSTGLSVLEIALGAGYEAHESFTRAFADLYRMPPSEYRKSTDPAPPEASPAIVSAAAYRIARLEALRIIYIRHLGPYDQVGAAWGRLMPWAGMRGLLGPGMRILGVVHDDPESVPAEQLRYDAALVVNRPVTPEGDIALGEIPAGDYAVALHIGPYSRVFDSYAHLCGVWLPQQGRELAAAPALEFYFNSPADTPPDELRTELWLPLLEP